MYLQVSSTAIILLSVVTAVLATTSLPTSSTTTLQCRLCSRASTLSDCNKLVTCDATLEECYMDELVTDQLTIVYNGGCRSKQVCALTGGKKKRADHGTCSQCCSFKNDCNSRLCGIKDDTLNSGQCFSCDHRTSEQSEVKNPSDCVTLEICQPNEMCYTTEENTGGVSTFFFGCYSKMVCNILMHNAYNDWKLCEKNITQPAPGTTWEQSCGSFKRSAALCHSCCNYGGCNYGTCLEQNDRLFNLALQGKFDMNTLTLV